MGILSYIESYLSGKGFTASQTSGIAAGIYAESQGDPNARNPTSGAFGIGQWLGSRKAALIARYGNNPTLTQQLDFLIWELKGGDHGGASVLNASSATDVLKNYITKFMRPAAGSETTGDLSRGAAYLSDTVPSSVMGNIRDYEKSVLNGLGLDGEWWTDPNASLTDLDPTGISGFLKSFFTGEMAGRFAAVIVGIILISLAIAAFALLSDTGKQVVSTAAKAAI